MKEGLGVDSIKNWFNKSKNNIQILNHSADIALKIARQYEFQNI